MGVVLSLLLSIVGGTSPAEATGNSAYLIELGLDEVRDMVYIREADRIVVVGDDEAQVYTREGVRTGRITGIPGAWAVEESGRYAVVVSPSTGELVVINAATAAVEKRILAKAQGISSITAVGDTVWYAHGPDQWDAGIGKATISTGEATPFFLDGYYNGGLIDASPGMPESVFYTPTGLSPADVRRFDTDGTEHDSPYHSTFRPIVVDEAGDYIYAFHNGSLVQMDTDTLERTGFFYEYPGGRMGSVFNAGNSIAIHNDEILAQGFSNTVAIYDMGAPAIKYQLDIPGEVRALDVTASEIFVVHGGPTPGAGTQASSKLWIVPHDFVAPSPQILVWASAYGDVETSERPTASWSCSDNSRGSGQVAYGGELVIQLSPIVTWCDVSLSSVPGLLAVDSQTGDGDFVESNSTRVVISVAGDHHHALFVHEFPSVYNDLTTFINQQYLDLLDRAPTTPEYQSAFERLSQGSITSAGFVAELAASDDFLGRVAPVSRLYLSYFDRWPDESGLSYWLMRSRGGMTLDAASDFFAGSTEFGIRYGELDNTEFVKLVYENVLGRSPDSAGYSYWTSQLSAGLSRGELMTGFSESPENINKLQATVVVRSLYSSLLEREPDAEGLAFWSNEYRQGRSLEGMVAGFLASNEYFNRFWHIDQTAGLRDAESLVEPTQRQSVVFSEELLERLAS